MSDVLAIAEAAMRNSIAAVDTVSHNIANASTTGFKREVAVRESFSAHLESAYAAVRSGPLDLSAAPLRYTGAPFHFAVEGDGWFQLRSPHGTLLTRDGSFAVDGEGRLVSKQGWPVVLDGEGNLRGATPALKENNELWANGERVGQFQLVTAPASQLQAAGAGLFRMTGASVSTSAEGSVRQGYLETSNVNTLSEMVTLIESMRQAEAAQRAMRAYDDAVASALTTLGEF